MAETAISVRDAVVEVWKTDRIPVNNSYDYQGVLQAEAKALAKATIAIPSPDDPPEFLLWIETLRKPDITGDEREAVYDAMYAYFEPDT
jgi:hypothetical protein